MKKRRYSRRPARPFFDGPTIVCCAMGAIIIALTVLNELGQWMYP